MDGRPESVEAATAMDAGGARAEAQEEQPAAVVAVDVMAVCVVDARGDVVEADTGVDANADFDAAEYTGVGVLAPAAEVVVSESAYVVDAKVVVAAAVAHARTAVAEVATARAVVVELGVVAAVAATAEQIATVAACVVVEAVIA